MTIYFCDIEADGFLEDVTKVHCISYKIFQGDLWFSVSQKHDFYGVFHGLTDNDTLVFHNSSGYDYPVLQKLGIIKDWDVAGSTVTLMDDTVKNVQSIDTLALSREWWPDNPAGHGLEAWAKRLGTFKPEINDWENLPIEEYISRCENDCITTEKVFEFLCDKLGVEL